MNAIDAGHKPRFVGWSNWFRYFRIGGACFESNLKKKKHEARISFCCLQSRLLAGFLAHWRTHLDSPLETAAPRTLSSLSHAEEVQQDIDAESKDRGAE